MTSQCSAILREDWHVTSPFRHNRSLKVVVQGPDNTHSTSLFGGLIAYFQITADSTLMWKFSVGSIADTRWDVRSQIGHYSKCTMKLSLQLIKRHGLSGQVHAPAALPQERAPGTHWIGSWVGLRARDAVEKALATAGSRTPVVQPVASWYTDWAIPVQGRNLILWRLFLIIFYTPQELIVQGYCPSYSGATRFESLPRILPSWLRFFVIFLSPSTQMQVS
jgi:hypothetical protein